jgi:hypothetical protein
MLREVVDKPPVPPAAKSGMPQNLNLSSVARENMALCYGEG